MDLTSLLVVAMAERCQTLIRESKQADSGLPHALHPRHLLWMCEQVELHAEEWPPTKLHRWIGFIQCGMMANHILNFEETKRMFDEARKAYGTNGEDEDLIDHLDPDRPFKFDVGGQG